MKKYILKRTMKLIPTFISAFIILFLIYTAMPGSILDSSLAKVKNENKIEQKYGFNESRYGKLILMSKKIITGKLEMYNLDDRQKTEYVMPIIFKMAKSDIILIFIVIIFSVIISIPLGVNLSRRKKSKIISLIMYLGMSIPTYVLAIILICYYKNSNFYNNYIVAKFTSAKLLSFDETLKRVITFIALSVTYIAQFTKRVETSTYGLRKRQFVVTATAYGYARRQIEYKYILKNAMIPIITVVGNSFALIFSELIVVQTALKSGGFGGFFLSMVYSRQYDAIFACVLFIIAIVTIFNYLVDLLYFVVDPRIKAY